MAMGENRKRTITDFFTPSKKHNAASRSPFDEVTKNNGKCVDADAGDRGVVIATHASIPQPHHTKSSSESQTKNAEIKTTSVPGLTLHEGFITPAEEVSLLAFLNDPEKCTWRTDLSRRSMHFGGTYCLFSPPSNKGNTGKSDVLSSGSKAVSKPEIIQAPPIPAELNWLLDRFSDRGIFGPSQRPQFCIVNEYQGNLGISAHVENFSFGEPVVGLSLLDDVDMRFHELVRPDGGSVRSGKAGRAEKTGRRVDVGLVGRGLCVMRGESRWRWQHEILRSRKGRHLGWKRVSLTFRWKEGG